MKRRTILLVFVAMLLVIASACSTTSDNTVASADATATADTTATATLEATVTPDATAMPTATATPDDDYDFEEDEATVVEGGGDFGYDDSEDYSGYVDPVLVGRWRSSDGGALTITEDGFITEIDFNCWTGPARIQNAVNDPAVYSIQISTDNGQANCIATFEYNWLYKIYIDDLSITEDEILNMPMNSMAEYIRVEAGDGIEGTWDSTFYGAISYQFLDDMTGWHVTNSTSYFIPYWSTSQNENGDDVILFHEEDPSYFDYSVSGDILTIYLSDGSRTYQRVGY